MGNKYRKQCMFRSYEVYMYPTVQIKKTLKYYRELKLMVKDTQSQLLFLFKIPIDLCIIIPFIIQ